MGNCCRIFQLANLGSLSYLSSIFSFRSHWRGRFSCNRRKGPPVQAYARQQVLMLNVVLVLIAVPGSCFTLTPPVVEFFPHCLACFLFIPCLLVHPSLCSYFFSSCSFSFFPSSGLLGPGSPRSIEPRACRFASQPLIHLTLRA